MHALAPLPCPTLRHPTHTRCKRLQCNATEDAPQPSPEQDAVLARIQRAREYKLKNTQTPLPPPAALQGSTGDEVIDRWLQSADGVRQKEETSFLEALAATPTTNNNTAPVQDTPSPPAANKGATSDARARGSGAGSADDAASFLKVLQDPNLAVDPNLRPEQFTLQREALRREQAAEIITVDQDYDAGMGGAYKPKVATWGVFPRPDNISQTYGGGRNLRPGQPLESEEQQAARQARVGAALARYRQQQGLVVDPEVEAAAQRAFDQGSQLFTDGKLEGALERFAEAAATMNVRTRLGAQARLQQAITLDSLGRNKEAYVLYRAVERSNAPGVAKTAKRMLYGWEASTFLKTDTVSYAVKREWDPYFTRLTGQWDNTYVAEGEEGGGVAIAAALAVILLPIGLIFVLLSH